jgi:hypothetical protein
MALLRIHIVGELNDLMRRLDIDAQLEIVHLVSVERIDDALDRLARGEWDFARIRAEGILY